MNHRVKFTKNNVDRYVDFDGMEDIDVAVGIMQELKVGETYERRTSKQSNGTHRQGDKVVLRVGKIETEFDTLEEAQAEADKLKDDVGYDIISLEQPRGSKSTVLIKSRPSFINETPE